MIRKGYGRKWSSGFIEIYMEGVRKTTEIEDSLRPGRQIFERDVFRIQAKSVMALCSFIFIDVC